MALLLHLMRSPSFEPVGQQLILISLCHVVEIFVELWNTNDFLCRYQIAQVIALRYLPTDSRDAHGAQLIWLPHRQSILPSLTRGLDG